MIKGFKGFWELVGVISEAQVWYTSTKVLVEASKLLRLQSLGFF
jgi:hypothetical protein